MDLYNIDKNEVNKRKVDYPKGTKVVLIRMNDAQAPKVGTKGIVRNVDDAGTIHIYWESGGSLGAIIGEDIVEIVN